MRTFLFFWALQMAALVLHAQVLHTKSSLNGTPSQTSDTIIHSNNPPDTVDYTLNLSELVVKATMPKTKMKNGAMVTRIEGSVLETAGTAEDMLSRVPGMMRRGGVLQVIGKGTPIYYINLYKIMRFKKNLLLYYIYFLFNFIFSYYQFSFIENFTENY